MDRRHFILCAASSAAGAAAASAQSPQKPRLASPSGLSKVGADRLKIHDDRKKDLQYFERLYCRYLHEQGEAGEEPVGGSPGLYGVLRDGVTVPFSTTPVSYSPGKPRFLNKLPIPRTLEPIRQQFIDSEMGPYCWPLQQLAEDCFLDTFMGVYDDIVEHTGCNLSVVCTRSITKPFCGDDASWQKLKEIFAAPPARIVTPQFMIDRSEITPRMMGVVALSWYLPILGEIRHLLNDTSWAGYRRGGEPHHLYLSHIKMSVSKRGPFVDWYTFLEYAMSYRPLTDDELDGELVT